MKIALLISGGGTTAEAVMKACASGVLKNVEPVLVIASKAGIGGIERVKNAGMKDEDVLVIDPKSFSTTEEFGEAILSECKKRNVEFVGQYGWLVKTPANVIRAYEGMMTNQHPGPLDIYPNALGGRVGRPDFGGSGMYGIRVHQARICFVRKTDREYWSEATAQRVAVNFDEGAVVCRKQVPILPDDIAESLQQRMLPVEHEVQIEALRMFVEGKVIEQIRETPLVLPAEEPILKGCKEEAIKLYPKA